MLFRVKLTGISWETDGEDIKSLGLPSDYETIVKADDELSAFECAISELSDKYGWLTTDFFDEEIERIEE